MAKATATASTKKVTKKKQKKKTPLTPQEVVQRKQRLDARNLFARIGFKRYQMDGHQFTFRGRTGEIDDCYVYENIVVLCEYTVGKVGSAHVAVKKLLYDLIHSHSSEWIEFMRALKPELANVAEKYALDDIRVKIVYMSLNGVSEEIPNVSTDIFFLDGTVFRYFEKLSKTIHLSANHEFFNFLKLDFSEIGAQVQKTSTSSAVFNGFLLPEANSSFPSGFKIVSFYADPGTLLAMSYVLRKDSWRDGEGLYQRILIPSKIRGMRRYLGAEKRVFVNNIVVTLPPSVSVNHPSNSSKNLDEAEQKKVRPVSITLPNKSNSIGLVDGQHRVFCYHQGTDSHETSIATMRDRQNLLVTGVIFPVEYTEVERLRFEAKLFLEINDTQTGAKAELKQSIELILHPYSTTAIAKAVILELARKGPLKDMLQTNFFDAPEKIKTTSMVSYGLKPLIKLSGSDSVFSLWKNANKDKLLKPVTQTDELRSAYIAFCVSTINELLLAFKMEYGPEKWVLSSTDKSPVLSPTILNGVFVCLRELIANGKVSNTNSYRSRFVGLPSFKFSDYKSSHWRKLGESMFNKYFI